ncbi:MAG: T9SS type A sorting domain-containing protein [Bacteroidales bacterium]|nr:T9SS type A sorting domain-containing protein [Bacteroidales bacterium]
MKKTLLFVILLVLCLIGNSQTITNTGAKVHIKDGTTVKFSNLYNDGLTGLFYYENSLEVSGNWINVPPATFNQGANGSVSFNGNSQQSIRSGGSAFNKLIVDNSAANNSEILLSDDMEIKTQLTLTDGILNTNNNNLIFQSTATTNSGNASSFVHGKMEKSGATQFTFPCGDVISRDLDGDAIDENYVVWSPIKSNPSASTTVNVEYFFDNVGMPDWWEHGGNMDATLHHVSDREYYFVSSTNDFTDVTLYWNDNDHAESAICVHSFCDGTTSNFSSADLCVAYWNGTMWVDAGASGSSSLVHDVGHITSSTTLPFGATNQTFITYGSRNNENPLPIELISVNADCLENAISIDWVTGSETNNAGFVIERSVDAKSFKQIAFIRGAGNSNTTNSYNFIDASFIKNEINYYRIKQVDFNNEFSYSPIVSAACKDNQQSTPSFSIYPNPFRQDINIVASELPADNTIVNIYNMLGSLVYQQKFMATKGMFSANIDLNNLPPAIYVVRVISGEYTGVGKIEKH